MSMPALRSLVLLISIIVISIIREIRRDGFQVTDLFAFLSSDDFKNAIGPTVEQMKNIGDEFKTFGIKSGFELGRMTLDVSEKVYEEFAEKKEQV